VSANGTSFATKLLRVKFTLSNGATFVAGSPGDPPNQLTLVGLRTTVQVLCQGFPAYPQCDLAIYGMAQSDMNALSSLTFEVTGVSRNTVQIDASSDGGISFSTVYAGQIVSSHIEYNPPEACLRVLAQMAFFDQINPATATAYTESVAVATVVSTIAAKMNFAFENNGVTLQTGGPVYYPGVLTEQLRDVVNHYGIDQYWEPAGQGSQIQTCAICPKGAARKLPTFNLSPSSGLLSYPQVDSRGYIRAKAMYNPAFRFGGPLTISGSDVVIDPRAPQTLNARANGNWMIGQMTHHLDALKFDGEWFSYLLLYPPGLSPPQQ
jgi:hypothetical protein